MFAIDELNGDPAAAYSAPLTVEFLKANPFLPIDTALFPAEFRQRLLAGIEDLDETTDGLLDPQRELPGAESAAGAVPRAGEVRLYRSAL